MTRGRLLTFEGVDGCGKTTQIGLLSRRLIDLGIDHVVTREPGGTTLGVKIRSLVLDADPNVNRSVAAPLSHVAEALLFAADRAQHVEEVIRPALRAGKLVLSDRFADSTRAFQGYGRSRDLATIDRLIDLATDGLKPDMTFLFDLPVEDGLARRFQTDTEKSPDRLDSESLEFHRRVRQGYLEMAAADPERFRVLDARQGIEALHEAVWRHLPALQTFKRTRP